MFPIYSSVIFEDVYEEAGTRPWVVGVEDEHGNPMGEYVVKLFTTFQNNNLNTFNKEIYGSILANEFGLFTPQVALVEFEDEFVKTLSPDRRRQLQNADPRIKFATKYLTPNPTYSPSLQAKDLHSNDIETIFAFDVLIRNLDRKLENPNLFLHQSNITLIDHQMSLNIVKPFNETNWNVFKKIDRRGHVLFRLLHKRKRKVSFRNFEQQLKSLNLEKLDLSTTIIQKHGYSINDFQPIKDYLIAAKENSSKFIATLKFLIH